MSSDKTPRGVNGGATGQNNRNSISSISSGDRRRQSTSTVGSTMFAGLMNQKRNSVDGASQARRAGFADQTKPPGFFGGLWHSFTKGGSSVSEGGSK